MPGLGFWNIAADNPDRVAVHGPDGTVKTAGELFGDCNALAAALREAGLGAGDVVAMVLPNGIEALTLLLAATQVGLMTVPINVNLAPAEIAYIVSDSGAKAVVAHERFADLAALASGSSAMSPSTRISVGAIPGFRPMAQMIAEHPRTTPPDRVSGFLMNYTSGTTGKPKGVRRPLIGHDPDFTGALTTALLYLFDVPPGHGVHLVTSPMYHTAVSGWALGMAHSGHTLVIMERWDPIEALELIQQHHVTTTHMVPTMFQRLLGLPKEVRESYDTSTLTHVIHTAAPCPAATKQAMFAWLGPVIYEYYAATEGGGTTATPQDWLAKPGTVGKPWEITKVEIRDPDGNPVASGQTGKVWMSMQGASFDYHGDEEKTASTWSGDFFTVGDIGFLDQDGFLFLCDREADIIIAGGVNIYPAEIESALAGHPWVHDVAVIGVPDDDLGEVVHAVVALSPEGRAAGAEALEGALLEWCANSLARYKWPRSVTITEELPRDPAGKLFRRKLRDRQWETTGRRI